MGASGRPIGKGCWSCGSTDHNNNKCSMREAKAAANARVGAGGRGTSGGRAQSGSSRPVERSGWVMRPRTGTQGPAGRTR